MKTIFIIFFLSFEAYTEPPSPSPRNYSQLHSAVIFENINDIKRFSRRTDINARDSENVTPFLNSVAVQNVRIVEFFLNHPKTDLFAKDVLNNNVFHFLFFGKRSHRGKILNLLLREEIFIKISHLLNEPNKDGQTSLDYLYREQVYGKVEISDYELRQLMKRGAKATLNLKGLLEDENIPRERKIKIVELILKVQKINRELQQAKTAYRSLCSRAFISN